VPHSWQRASENGDQRAIGNTEPEEPAPDQPLGAEPNGPADREPEPPSFAPDETVIEYLKRNVDSEDIEIR
jgi:hypothetical protein